MTQFSYPWIYKGLSGVISYNILQMLLSFDKVFDTMSKEDQRQLLESMIAEVHRHPKETWEEGKNPIKEIQYTFPIFNGEDKSTLGENLASVQTVILLQRGNS